MSTTLLVVQHVDREGPDLIETLALERGMSIRVLRPDQGAVLPSPVDCPDTIALVLGGPMGVNERHNPELAWLQRELDWIGTWHRHSKPILGICLGAQLLAAAAGGSIETLTSGDPPQDLKELGIGSIHWVINPSDEPWLQGLNPSEPVLHWHGDRIRLPADATLLASTLHCPEQVFRIGAHAIGLQCHWEVSAGNLERWITEDQAYVMKALGPDGPTLLRQQWTTSGAVVEQRGRLVLTQILKGLHQQIQ